MNRTNISPRFPISTVRIALLAAAAVFVAGCPTQSPMPQGGGSSGSQFPMPPPPSPSGQQGSPPGGSQGQQGSQGPPGGQQGSQGLPGGQQGSAGLPGGQQGGQGEQSGQQGSQGQQGGSETADDGWGDAGQAQGGSGGGDGEAVGDAGGGGDSEGGGSGSEDFNEVFGQTGRGGSGSDSEDAFERSLEDFDETFGQEQEELARRGAGESADEAIETGNSAGLPGSSAEDIEDERRELARVDPDEIPDVEALRGGNPVEGCDDEDVVARQLCEIATLEEDPFLKAALWEEYNEYRRIIARQ